MIKHRLNILGDFMAAAFPAGMAAVVSGPAMKETFNYASRLFTAASEFINLIKHGQDANYIHDAMIHLGNAGLPLEPYTNSVANLWALGVGVFTYNIIRNAQTIKSQKAFEKSLVQTVEDALQPARPSSP